MWEFQKLHQQLLQESLRNRGNDAMRVTVIDYKAGNLTSVLKSLHHVGAETEVTDVPGPL